MELVPKTQTDQKVENPKKKVTELRNKTMERLREESLTGNGERELWTDNFPMSEARDSVQNTRQTYQLLHESTAGKLKEDTVKINDDARDGKKSPEFSNIKMPPKILKRGRPKRAEGTAIGLPRKKK